MGANFPRIKTWTSAEDVTASDLNAEFDNILNNLTAANVDDFSANVSQMQSTVDPGEVGSESLATSVAGEIQRLRHMIGEITGEDEWYSSPVSSILGLANAIGTGITDNRLVSGRVRTTSAQPLFLTANGAARTVTLKATATNFVYYVNGTEYSIALDTNLTGLTAAPSSNNTTLVNNANFTGQDFTKTLGEDESEIPVDTMGSEISALVGKFAVFKVVHSAVTEYFLAYVKSTTAITKCRRGYFFDSTDAPVNRVALSDNDVITLLKATWVFAKTDGTLTATYNTPVFSDDEPTSPTIGDYWFDYSANRWKVYGIGSYSDANAVLIGLCAQDATNTVCARAFEFFKGYDTTNTVELFYESATQVKSRNIGSTINVWGTTFKNDYNLHTWDMTLDLDSGVTEAASTFYFFYLTETGDKIISNVKPFDRREDLKGYYHPFQSWRCVGYAYNDGSSNLGEIESYFRRNTGLVLTPAATAATFVETLPRVIRVSGSGGAVAVYLPSAASCRGQEYVFYRTDNTIANAVTLTPFGSDTINGYPTYPLYTQFESLHLISDGANWLVLSHFANSEPTSYVPAIVGLGTPTAVESFFSRQSDEISVFGKAISGTPTAVALTITLPGTLNMKTTGLPAVRMSEQLGTAYGNIDTSTVAIPATTRGPFAVTSIVGDTQKVTIVGDVDKDQTASGTVFLQTLANAFNTSGRYLIWEFRCKINEWKP